MGNGNTKYHRETSVKIVDSLQSLFVLIMSPWNGDYKLVVKNKSDYLDLYLYKRGTNYKCDYCYKNRHQKGIFLTKKFIDLESEEIIITADKVTLIVNDQKYYFR